MKYQIQNNLEIFKQNEISDFKQNHFYYKFNLQNEKQPFLV